MSKNYQQINSDLDTARNDYSSDKYKDAKKKAREIDFEIIKAQKAGLINALQSSYLNVKSAYIKAACSLKEKDYASFQTNFKIIVSCKNSLNIIDYWERINDLVKIVDSKVDEKKLKNNSASQEFMEAYNTITNTNNVTGSEVISYLQTQGNVQDLEKYIGIVTKNQMPITNEICQLAINIYKKAQQWNKYAEYFKILHQEDASQYSLFKDTADSILKNNNSNIARGAAESLFNEAIAKAQSLAKESKYINEKAKLNIFLAETYLDIRKKLGTNNTDEIQKSLKAAAHNNLTVCDDINDPDLLITLAQCKVNPAVIKNAVNKALALDYQRYNEIISNLSLEKDLDFIKAFDLCKELVNHADKTIDVAKAYIFFARIFFYNQSNIEKSKEAFELVTKTSGNKEDVAEAYLALGNYELAAKNDPDLYKKAEDPNILLNLAKAYYDKANNNSAINAMSKAVNKNPTILSDINEGDALYSVINDNLEQWAREYLNSENKNTANLKYFAGKLINIPGNLELVKNLYDEAYNLTSSITEQASIKKLVKQLPENDLYPALEKLTVKATAEAPPPYEDTTTKQTKHLEDAQKEYKDALLKLNNDIQSKVLHHKKLASEIYKKNIDAEEKLDPSAIPAIRKANADAAKKIEECNQEALNQEYYNGLNSIGKYVKTVYHLNDNDIQNFYDDYSSSLLGDVIKDETAFVLECSISQTNYW